MEIKILIYALGVIILIVAYFFYNKFKKLYDLILNTETFKITTIKKGFYEIRGKVVKIDKELQSPYSESKCVYYKFKVEQEKSNGKSSTWRTIINDEQFVRFYIEDSSGKAIIDLDGAKLKFNKDISERSGGFWKAATHNMENTLAKYGKTSKAWIFEKKLRYHETFLEEGDNVFAIGEVVDFEGYYPVFRKNKLPFIVSDKSEESLLHTYKLSYQAFLFGGIVFGLGLIFFGLYF